MANRWGNSDTLYLGGASKSLQMVTAAIKLKTLTPWRESYDKPTQHIKKTETSLANKGRYSQTMVFPVDMYRYESWTL